MEPHWVRSEVTRRKILVNRHEVYDAQNRLRGTLRPRGIWQKWLIEDADGRQLAEVKMLKTFRGKWQILRGGEVIAQIQAPSFIEALKGKFVYQVDISHKDFDPLLILSCTVLTVDSEKRQRDACIP